MTTLPSRPDIAVRVLHTSDWHLGVTVANESRSTDYDDVLDEIVDVAISADPDLILHTGDLFNTSRPAMSEFRRAIEVLRRLGDVAPVLALSGNHDSSETMAALGVAVSDPVPQMVQDGTFKMSVSHGAEVRVHHRPSLPEDGAVMTYPTRTGGNLRIASLPFMAVNRFVDDFDDLVNPTAAYVDNLRKVHDLLAAKTREDFDPERDVAVFASHLFVSGSTTSSEKEIHVGDHYATDPAHLKDVYGYLAFGHIHVPQNVGANGRYAGSILEVDFGEAGEQKRVLVADLEPGRPPEIHDIPLKSGRRLVRIKSPLSLLPGRAAEIGDAIAEVTVLAEDSDEAQDAVGPEEPTKLEESSGPFESVTDNSKSVDGEPEDDPYSLSSRVRSMLPRATVVRIIDLRNPSGMLAAALAPGESAPAAERSVAEEYRDWLAGPGLNVIEQSTTDHAPDLELAIAILETAIDVSTSEGEFDRQTLDALAVSHGHSAKIEDRDTGDNDDAT